MNQEDRLQQKIVIAYRNMYEMHGLGMIFSIPNGGSRNVAEAIKLKETGLRAGVSDLIVLHGNKTIFVEVKIPTGVQSPAQKKFEEKVKKLGFQYIIVRSVEEFLLHLLQIRQD